MGKKGKSKGKNRSKGKGKHKAAATDTAAAAEAELVSVTAARPAADAGVAAAAPRIEATELAARLANLSTVLQRQLGRSDSGDGLTRARLSALALLVLGGPRTLGDLAAAERVRPPTMTRLVHAMEDDGLVARAPHPTDGRSVIIRATAKGEAMLEEGRSTQIAPLADRISDLDDDERVLLESSSDLLGRVLRDTDRAGVEPHQESRALKTD